MATAVLLVVIFFNIAQGWELIRGREGLRNKLHAYVQWNVGFGSLINSKTL